MISADQMKHSLMCAEGGKRTTEREVDEMLTELDLDQDGKVKMEDFVRLLVNETNFPPSRSTTSCNRCCVL